MPSLWASSIRAFSSSGVPQRLLACGVGDKGGRGGRQQAAAATCYGETPALLVMHNSQHTHCFNLIVLTVQCVNQRSNVAGCLVERLSPCYPLLPLPLLQLLPHDADLPGTSVLLPLLLLLSFPAPCFLAPGLHMSRTHLLTSPPPPPPPPTHTHTAHPRPFPSRHGSPQRSL